MYLAIVSVSDIPNLVIVSVRVKKVMDTSRLKLQLQPVDSDVPRLRAHSG